MTNISTFVPTASTFTLVFWASALVGVGHSQDGGTGSLGESLPGSSDPAASAADPAYVVRDFGPAFRTEDLQIIPTPQVGLDDVVRAVNKQVDFDIRLTGGYAYDTNTRLTPDNEIAGWVGWTALGGTLDVGDQASMGLYYGADLNGHFFTYDTNQARAGRNAVEPMVNLYAGIRGARTNLRVDTLYRINYGNVADLTATDREARRAQSDDFNISLSGQRTFDHGLATGSVTFDERDFASATGLNDVTSVIWDGAWFYQPAFTPKTQWGLGLRGGEFDADRNVSQSFWQPSLRINYNYSAKTQVFSRFGYDLRNFEGQGAIGSNNAFVYELGARWMAAQRTSFDLVGYRDFSPSFVTGFESFNRTGVRGGMNHQLPWWDLRLRVESAYENASYFSTLVGGSSSREDDYWTFGGNLSRPFRITDALAGEIAAFYAINANDSTIRVNEFSQQFTGVRFGITY